MNEDAALRLRLEASITQFERRMAKATGVVDRFSDRSSRSTARASTAMTRNLNRSTQAFDANARSQRAFRGGVQNTAFQLQDIVVQLQAGTSATRALSQQLPQLLGGFGALGAAIGVVVGLGIPLVSTLFSIGDAAEEIDATSFESLKSNMADLADMEARYADLIKIRQRVQSTASNNAIDQLGKEIELKRAQMALELIQAQARRDQLRETVRLEQEAIAAQARSLPGNFNGRDQQVEDLGIGIVYTADQRRQVAEAQQALEMIDEARLANLRAISAELAVQEILVEQYGNAVEDGNTSAKGLAAATGDAATEVEKIANRMNAAYALYASTRVEAQQKAQAALDELAQIENQAALLDVIATQGRNILDATQARVQAERDAYVETLATRDVSEELKAQLIAAWDAANGVASVDMAGNITLAANEAARLAANLDRAIALAPITSAMQDEDAAMGQAVTPNASGRARQRDAVENFNSTLERNARSSRGGGRSGGGSGGGGSGGGQSEAQREADRERNESLREAERIFDQTRTKAEQYAAEIEDLNDLHRMGYLDADTFGRAMEDLEERMNADQFEGVQRAIESVSSAIADAIVNGENLGDAFRNVLKRMAADLISSGIQGIIQNLFTGVGGGGGGGGGGFLGRLFRSFEGGGHTGRGARSGGMDGRGGFMAMLHPNETVVDHTRAGGMAMAASPVRVEVVARNEPGTLIEVIRSEAGQTVSAGLRQYDSTLPARVNQIRSDPRRR